MPPRVARKWRPPLALVLGGTLAAVFALPLIGIAYFRVAGGVLGWAETSWMIGWMALAAALILGAFLWRLVLRPIRRLTDYAVSKGEGTAPTHFGTPEFSRLAQSVLMMTETLRGRETVIRSYADHVTHEMTSPLTAIRGAAELLSDPDLAPEGRLRLLSHINAALDRMEGLLDGQRAFAKADQVLGAGSVRLCDAAQGLTIANVSSDGLVPLRKDLLAMVLGHLHDNAVAHGAKTLTLKWAGDRLIVSDDGPGISMGNRDRIFDPYFTTRRDQGGTGMGLAIVRRMLEAHGAGIELLEGEGAVLEIRT